MKKYLFLSLVLISAGVMAQDNLAKFKWDSPEFDFGKIAKEIPVSHEFSFVNTGKETLIITEVKASCGCTTPTWPRDPLPPGASGTIKATFNAATMGIFNKSITVTANVEGGTAVLTIKGEVVEKVDVKSPVAISKAGSDAGGTLTTKKETPLPAKKAENGGKKGGKTVKKKQ